MKCSKLGCEALVKMGRVDWQIFDTVIVCTACSRELDSLLREQRIELINKWLTTVKNTMPNTTQTETG